MFRYLYWETTKVVMQVQQWLVYTDPKHGQMCLHICLCLLNIGQNTKQNTKHLCSDEHQDGVCVYTTACVTSVLFCLWRLSHGVSFSVWLKDRKRIPLSSHSISMENISYGHIQHTLPVHSIWIYTRSNNTASIVTLSTPLNCMQTPVSCVAGVVMYVS